MKKSFRLLTALNAVWQPFRKKKKEADLLKEWIKYINSW